MANYDNGQVENIEARAIELRKLLLELNATESNADRDACGTLYVNLCALSRVVQQKIEALERRHGF